MFFSCCAALLVLITICLLFRDWNVSLGRAHCVALVTGDGFGYPKGIRISYAASMEDIDEALGEVRCPV